MSAVAKAGKPGSRGEPEKTRAAILHAALEEFSHEGAAGARTDEIARRAGVNKALLYYYFKDKEGLYAAALDEVFGGLSEHIQAALRAAHLAPRERLLGYMQAHFDYIASTPTYPGLVQREFMRSGGRTLSPVASRIIERYGRPILEKLGNLIREGIAAGEFRKVDPEQTVTSLLGIIVYYFISPSAKQLTASGDPFAPERLAARRAAVLDFVSAALFVPAVAPKGKTH